MELDFKTSLMESQNKLCEEWKKMLNLTSIAIVGCL